MSEDQEVVGDDCGGGVSGGEELRCSPEVLWGFGGGGRGYVNCWGPGVGGVGGGGEEKRCDAGC